MSHKIFGAQFLLQVFVFFPVFLVRMRRNTINHKGNILFAFPVLLFLVGTFAEYPLLHFSQQCFRSLYGKQQQIFFIEYFGDPVKIQQVQTKIIIISTINVLHTSP